MPLQDDGQRVGLERLQRFWGQSGEDHADGMDQITFRFDVQLSLFGFQENVEIDYTIDWFIGPCAGLDLWGWLAGPTQSTGMLNRYGYA